jgi:hypothetical protein
VARMLQDEGGNGSPGPLLADEQRRHAVHSGLEDVQSKARHRGWDIVRRRGRHFPGAKHGTVGKPQRGDDEEQGEDAEERREKAAGWWHSAEPPWSSKCGRTSTRPPL